MPAGCSVWVGPVLGARPRRGLTPSAAWGEEEGEEGWMVDGKEYSTEQGSDNRGSGPSFALMRKRRL